MQPVTALVAPISNNIPQVGDNDDDGNDDGLSTTAAAALGDRDWGWQSSCRNRHRVQT